MRSYWFLMLHHGPDFGHLLPLHLVRVFDEELIIFCDDRQDGNHDESQLLFGLMSRRSTLIGQRLLRLVHAAHADNRRCGQQSLYLASSNTACLSSSVACDSIVARVWSFHLEIPCWIDGQSW